MLLQLSKPFVLWLTGLSGSGKSTLACELAKKFELSGIVYEQLDGDVVRELIGDQGFTKEERDRHLRHIGFTARSLEKHGIPVIASFVSPYRDTRRAVRAMCQSFIEVYVKASLEECERRDPKGLYKLARAERVKNFTGISAPYEEPQKPELILDSLNSSPRECAEEVLDYLIERKALRADH